MRLATILPLLICLIGCSKEKSPNYLIESATIQYSTKYIPNNSEPITMGGVGSAIAYDKESSIYYLLSNRGPSFEKENKGERIFPLPYYTPQIATFKCQRGVLTKVESIELKDSSGRALRGIPMQNSKWGSNEKAYDMHGRLLSGGDEFTINPQGIALGKDNTIWISDQYGPHIMQFDRSGVMLKQLSPGQGLPNRFAQHGDNCGLTGITISADYKKLYAIMSVSLEATNSNPLNCRLLEIDLQDYSCREYWYELENRDNSIGDIYMVNDSLLYILEGDNSSTNAKVYSISLANASDVSNIEIENQDRDELRENGVIELGKRLKIDLQDAIPYYPHNRTEGLTMINDGILAIINNDEFGIISDGKGGFSQKLDSRGKVDRGSIYYLNCDK